MQADTTSWPTDTELNWTPRQLEVIELVAKGHTNAQIADRLDISLAGAKWHVSEVLSKLGVESREAIPDYWRWRRSPVRALRRRFALALPALPLAPTFAGATIVGIALVGGILLAASWPSNEPGAPAEQAQQEAPDPVESARSALAELAALAHFPGSSDFDPNDTSGFELQSVEDVFADGEPAQRVVLVHPGIEVWDMVRPLTFEATISAATGEVLARGFETITEQYDLPDFPLAIGPHYEVARSLRADGVVEVLSIGKDHAGDWWFLVSAPDSENLAISGLKVGDLQPGSAISGTGGRGLVLGIADESVAIVRATLEDGSVMEIVPVSPPENLGFVGNIYFAPSAMQYANSVRAFDNDGTELSRFGAVARPPDP